MIQNYLKRVKEYKKSKKNLSKMFSLMIVQKQKKKILQRQNSVPEKKSKDNEHFKRSRMSEIPQGPVRRSLRISKMFNPFKKSSSDINKVDKKNNKKVPDVESSPEIIFDSPKPDKKKVDEKNIQDKKNEVYKKKVTKPPRLQKFKTTNENYNKLPVTPSKTQLPSTSKSPSLTPSLTPRYTLNKISPKTPKTNQIFSTSKFGKKKQSKFDSLLFREPFIFKQPLNFDNTNIFEVIMKKINGKLGFIYSKLENPTPGYYIERLTGEPAIKDGRIMPGDKILSIDDVKITLKTREQVLNIFKSVKTDIKLLLQRDIPILEDSNNNQI